MTEAGRALGLECSHLYKKCLRLGIDIKSLRRPEEQDIADASDCLRRTLTMIASCSPRVRQFINPSAIPTGQCGMLTAFWSKICSCPEYGCAGR